MSDDKKAKPEGKKSGIDADAVRELSALLKETGLTQVIWLRKGQGQDDLIIEVTPGYRYDADNVTQLALEPIVVQISGGLYQRDFERVSAWAMANRDLIDDVWDGTVTSLEDVNERVKKVPAPGWR